MRQPSSRQLVVVKVLLPLLMSTLALSRHLQQQQQHLQQRQHLTVQRLLQQQPWQLAGASAPQKQQPQSEVSQHLPHPLA
jgi:hypothetical protein